MKLKEKCPTVYSSLNQNFLQGLFCVSRSTISSWLNKESDLLPKYILSSFLSLEEQMNNLFDINVKEIGSKRRGRVTKDLPYGKTKG